MCVSIVPISHCTQILFNLGVAMAALLYIPILAHSETLKQPKSAPQAVVFPCLLSAQASASEAPFPSLRCSRLQQEPVCTPLPVTVLVTAQARRWAGAEAVRRKEAKFKKLHYSQFPQTFFSSGESIYEAFPGPVCWLGMAAPQFPWEQPAYLSSSGNSSLATGKEVTSQEPGSKPPSLPLLRRSQVGSWKKMLRKGKISCWVLRGYLGQNGTVEGQCCAPVSHWWPKLTGSSVTPAWPPHPCQGTGEAECFRLLLPNCKESKLHWTGCGYLLQARTSGFNHLHPSGRWWCATKWPWGFWSLLCLGKSRDFPIWQGSFQPQRGRQRQRQRTDILRKKKVEVKMKWCKREETWR